MSKNEKELKDKACDCNEEDCGCDTITLELEDGTSQEFEILDTLEFEEKNYIALAPLDSDEYYIYGFKEEGENVEFFSIDDDKEFEKISELFEKKFSEEVAE
jgi:uncharacterized protein YrzB (UPF0473 family)